MGRGKSVEPGTVHEAQWDATDQSSSDAWLSLPWLSAASEVHLSSPWEGCLWPSSPFASVG